MTATEERARNMILFGIDAKLDCRLVQEARRLGITRQALLDRVIPAGLRAVVATTNQKRPKRARHGEATSKG